MDKIYEYLAAGEFTPSEFLSALIDCPEFLTATQLAQSLSDSFGVDFSVCLKSATIFLESLQ